MFHHTSIETQEKWTFTIVNSGLVDSHTNLVPVGQGTLKKKKSGSSVVLLLRVTEMGIY